MNEWSKIKHLYSRAGFGLTLEESNDKKKSSIKNELKFLFPKRNNKIKLLEHSLKKNDKKLIPKLAEIWVDQMNNGKNPLLEKMTLFWHDHFACRSKLPLLASNQINTIRENALGNFRDLVQNIAKDPSMILYLNNQQNNKMKPNENFARELLELFTIGIGHYSEKDIKEAGRAFTGWKIDKAKGTFRFVERQHDFGEKEFMGKKGNFNGDEIIDIVLSNKECASFIAKKVYAYFINPKIDPKRVEEISDIFYKSDYNISKMMKFIFSSDWFYDKKNMGVKIKSPIELFLGIKKIVRLNINNNKIHKIYFRKLGQVLFNPPNVAGWPGDKAWINNSTLMFRLNLPFFFMIAKDASVKGYEQKKNFKAKTKSSDITHIIKNNSSNNKTEIRNQLLDILLLTPLTIPVSTIDIGISENNKSEIIFKYIFKIMSLPEYQLC